MKTLNNFLSKFTLTTNKVQNYFFLFVITFMLTSFFAVLIHFCLMNWNEISL